MCICTFLHKGETEGSPFVATTLPGLGIGERASTFSRLILTSSRGRTAVSGKPTVCYGKSPFFMGKSTING